MKPVRRLDFRFDSHSTDPCLAPDRELRHPEKTLRVEHNVSLREKLYSLRFAGPLVLVIASVIAGIYLGIFTPTEAGAAGAVVTLLLAIVRLKGIRGLELRKTLLDTIQTTAMIFGVIICALIFSRFLAISGVTQGVEGILTSLHVNRWVVVFAVTMVYLVLGTMMDAPGLLAISIPVTHPVMMELGFDPVWFGIYVVLLVEVAAVSPPAGLNCFVVQAASDGRIRLEEIFHGLMPFLIAAAVMLVVLCLFPQLALYLPDRM